MSLPVTRCSTTTTAANSPERSHWVSRSRAPQWSNRRRHMADDLRDRITKVFQKNVANRMMRLMPFQTLLETTGRRSGEPRRTPLGGRREGDQFWFVSEFG